MVARRSVVGWIGAALTVVVGAGIGATAVAGEVPWRQPAAETTAAGTTASAPPGGVEGPRSVTLLTGDRVIVDPARQRYEFHPAPGREKLPYQSRSVRGHRYVIPGDARVLVASGRLDLRLFDVSALAAAGGDLPLVVTDEGGARPERVAAGATARRWAELTEASPASAGARQGSRRLRTGIRSVALDGVPPARPARAAAAQESELTFVYRDRDGAASADAGTFLIGIDDPDTVAFAAPGSDGVGTVRLPKGRYHAESFVDTPRPGRDSASTSVLVNPELTVDGDARVEIAAAVAQPVTITVPDPAALGLLVYVSYRRALAGGHITGGMVHPDPGAMFAAHVGPSLPGDTLAAFAGAFFARPGPAGTVTDSPVVYGTGWHQQGRFFNGLRKQLAESDLSTVRAEHASVAPGRHVSKSTVAVVSADDGDSSYMGYHIEYTATPFTRVERYAGTLQWANRTVEYAATDDPNPGNRVDVTVQQQSPTSYKAGHRYAERWNLAPFWPDPQVRRGGDTISVQPTLYADQTGGREGTSAYRRARVALYRDGQPVGESNRLDRTEFTVPAGRAGYRLTVEAERSFTELAKKTSTTWTFNSERSDVAEGKLPLLSVRYAPPVDQHNRAPAGQAVSIPVHVERGGPGPALRSLTVEVSYDGGTTWRQVRVDGQGDRRVAVVHHPAGGGLVSMRAKAIDAGGGAVEQTIVNAYRLA